MEYNLALVSMVFGMSAIITAFYGNRFRKRRYAAKLRRRGYKEYNRGRPKLITHQPMESVAEKSGRP